MKIAGHTMGTPEYSLLDAARLFSDIGLDAIEIIFQEEYKCALHWNTTNEELQHLKKELEELHLEVSCIVSYASDYNQEDKERRNAALRECRHCIELAHTLGARYIRIYGGTFLEGDADFDTKKELLVASMRTLADEAADYGINLVMENHFNTMTTGPQITYDIVSEIGRENVGILYDQANIGFLSGEDYRKCIEIQKDKIYYVHVKDYLFKDKGKKFTAGSVSHVKEEDRAVVTKIVGEGEVPWEKILPELKRAGYDGYLSLEYERRWHPMDIPRADTGMARSAQHIRSILARMTDEAQLG
jgi:sugar phosphate isomerase/epimerase